MLLVRYKCEPINHIDEKRRRGKNRQQRSGTCMSRHEFTWNCLEIWRLSKKLFNSELTKSAKVLQSMDLQKVLYATAGSLATSLVGTQRTTYCNTHCHVSEQHAVLQGTH